MIIVITKVATRKENNKNSDKTNKEILGNKTFEGPARVHYRPQTR